MKLKTEHTVRCGNKDCIHNSNGYVCNNVIVALDTAGKCALYNSRTKKVSSSSSQPEQTIVSKEETSV